MAAFLSFLWPGLGQLYVGRRVAALVFATPITLLAVYAAVQFLASPAMFALRLLVPSIALTALALVVAAGVWRLLSMLDAVLAARTVPTKRPNPLVVVALALVVVLVHGVMAYWAWSFYSSGSRIFVAPASASRPAPRATPPTPPAPASPGASASVDPEPTPQPTPEPTPEITPDPIKDRINVVITGLDASRERGDHKLTDTLMVVSFDPGSRKVAMVSFPRDIANFRLSNGQLYPDKINTFYRYAKSHEEEYPEGPMRALARELGHLLGIRIHHYASINLDGFERMIDVVGGVDVVNEREIDDPGYGFGDGVRGFHLPAGPHHLDGRLALAFARSRKGHGDSDFTRAERQQQLLLELRRKMTDPAMLPRLPEILDAAAQTITTDLPPERVPGLLELAQGIDDENVERVVLAPPYSFHPPVTETGGLWTLKLDMERVRQLSIELFGADSRYARGD